jgi:hypothetical protein
VSFCQEEPVEILHYLVDSFAQIGEIIPKIGMQLLRIAGQIHVDALFQIVLIDGIQGIDRY